MLLYIYVIMYLDNKNKKIIIKQKQNNIDID